MKNAKLLLLPWTLLASCTDSRQEKVIRFLTNDSQKYWMHIPAYPEKRFMGVRYKSNGTYQMYSTLPGKRVHITTPYSTIWKMSKDSVLTDGMNTKYRIEYIDENILVLNPVGFKQVIVYVKEKDQATEPVAEKPRPFKRM
jgi:hypothetical protein